MKRSNLTLVGFMGTGKTTCGRIAAKRLGLELVDMDELIEAREEKKISDIFAEDGEPAFRRLESELARELSEREGLVVAAGGGAVLDPANMKAFAEAGVVVCLLASEETIFRRVEQARHRPLLEDGEMSERIRHLLHQRKAVYEGVPLQVVTDGLDAETVADRVVALYHRHA